jgi:3-oxoacyl-[acyl-carrier protein] reductase
MSKKLKGKVALVTGGSRGIGAATARGLADEGADVAISYAASANKAEAVVRDLAAKGVKAAAFQADQADSSQVEGLVKAVFKHFGRLDILVNNAGVAVLSTIDNPARDAAAVARLFAINVGGVAAAVCAAAPLLGEGGRIISLGSVGALWTGMPGLADYAATKGAVAAYTRGWARDLAPKGITVNVVQPGPVDTDMNPDNTEFAARLKAATALGRYAKPEEIAAVVVFLASPAASYITGAAIDVNGGMIA